ERLIERTRAMTTGDPAARDVFFGPVINAGAVQKFERAVAQARREGTILLGGQRLTGGAFDRGHFVAPTIAVLPLTSSLFLEELFVPLLAGVEAGVCYVNKRTGATTGAWPGAQPFTGWKGSGSTGKGGCGPYYVAQFMREQSRTVIEA